MHRRPAAGMISISWQKEHFFAERYSHKETRWLRRLVVRLFLLLRSKHHKILTLRTNDPKEMAAN
jgi:hypothetical protein